MTRKNYLPFAQRQFLGLQSAYAAGAPTVSTLSVGMGERLFLDDLSIFTPATGGGAIFPYNNITVRLGWRGKGYLLEKRIPVGLYINKGRPLCSVWEFPKPYRMKPTERLTVRVTPGTGVVAPNRYQGIMFNGKRLDDGRPVYLYDSSEATVAVGVDTPLVNDTLRAPEDTEIELYSVSVPDWLQDNTTGATDSDIRVWGPDRREWLKFEIQPPGTALTAGMTGYSRWINPPGDLISLGEDRGWVLDSNETFMLEFESFMAGTPTLMITLRGSLEVTSG